MIYKFRIISDENEQFLRTIEIDENDTFLSLHTIILKSCEYTNSEITSFFISNKCWDKEQEITLLDMDEDTNTMSMGKTKINSFIKKIDDRLIYLFDFFNDRALYCSLTDIKPVDKNKNYPVCSYSVGNAPLQQLNNEDDINEINEMFQETELDIDNDFLDNEDDDDFGFNNDEFNNEDYDNDDYDF